MGKWITTTILIFIISYPTQAQKATFQFYTTADGLAGNDVSRPVQDAQGMIWLISGGQLQKFDGHQFMTYPARPTDLPGADEPLSDIVLFQDSLLFIAAQKHAFLLHPLTQHWQSFEIGNNYSFQYFNHLENDAIYFMVILDDVNSLSGRVFKKNGIEQDPVFQSLNGHYYDQTRDTNQNTYVINKDFLLKFSPEGKRIAERPSPKFDRFQRINVTPDGNIFLSADRFYLVDNQLNKLTLHPANRFLTPAQLVLTENILLMESGSFWASGRNRTLFYYDAPKDTLINLQEQVGEILADRANFAGLFEDRTGNIWVRADLGLLKISLNHFPFDNYLAGTFEDREKIPSNYSFRGFSEDASGLIYGGFYGGLAIINPFRKQVTSYFASADQIDFPLPYDLQVDGDDLWFNNGSRFHLESGKIEKIPGSSYLGDTDSGLFAYDEEGRLWWDFVNQLFYLNKDSTQLFWQKVVDFQSPDQQRSEAMHFGKQSGKLWIGHQNQLYGYQPLLQKLETYDNKNWQIPINRILAIQEDSAQHLWMGTDIGLVHFEPKSGTTQQFTTKEGLPNNFICGLLTEGDSALWMSTNHGLSRFSIASQAFINFFEEDGLTHNEFNRMSYFKASDDRLFFGGLRGVNAFYPQQIMEAYSRKNEQASLVLSAFEKVDEKLDTNIRQIVFDSEPTIHLYHWDRSFSFQFALTDYTNPEEIYYSYQLEGYEERWSKYNKFNSIRFSSLPVGRYTFRVKARDYKGLEHPSQLKVHLVVHPPWWKTWWAYLVYFLILVGIILLIYHFLRRRWILQNELKKEQEEAIRLKELDTFKSRLYTNLTHEFRTPLTVILGMAEELEDSSKGHLKERIQLIRNNGNQLLQLINQLLDLSKLENNSFKLKIEQGDIIAYLSYLTQSFHTFANSKNLALAFFAPVKSMIMDYDPEQIKQVMTNLISNAVKFTPSGGSIEVQASQEDDQLLIQVSDTGVGIPEKDLPHIFDRFYQVDNSSTREGEGTGIGLAHTRELVKLMQGQITVTSKVDGDSNQTGTQFQIRLPITKAATTPRAETISLPETNRAAVDAVIQSSILNEPDQPIDSTLPQLLIVEDNPDVVKYLHSCLKDKFQLDIAYNGAIGIKKALQDIPDLIISDVMMPEKNGYELCDTLKNDERTSHIPIILLTAKSDTDSRISGLKSGADAYLSKPFNKTELLVRLEMLVKKKEQLTAYFAKKFQGGIIADTVSVYSSDPLPMEDAFIHKVRQIVTDNYEDEHFALPDLCSQVGMSRSQLYRKMKALIDISPSDFIRIYRLEKAKSLLSTKEFTVSEVAWKVGYKDISHFSRSFESQFGVRPSEANN